MANYTDVDIYGQGQIDKAGCHVSMVRRHEANDTQPTLEVTRKLAVALSVSADTLVFEHDERGPDNTLRLQFEALSAMPTEEQEIAMAVLDAMILELQVAGALERVRKPAARTTKKPRWRA